MAFESQLFGWIFVISIVNLNIELCIGGDGVFDLFVFTQTWPFSECAIYEAQDENNACVLPSKKDTWTIHGIWPSKKSISSPQQPAFCPTLTPNFDAKSMESNTLEQLKQYWPNVHKDNTDEKFWEYEWNKHGKCAAPLEEFASPSKYFKQGLKWIQEYSIYDVLSRAYILPGSVYDVTEVNNAIKNRFNVNAMISCTKLEDKQYLREIKLCFDKQLEMMDCEQTSSKPIITNCDEQRKLDYPDHVPDQDHGSSLWRFTYRFTIFISLVLIGLFAYKVYKSPRYTYFNIF